jgi:bifunctional DNA-binding transcriptional regulator/antitoxin component of YhaV-PrlF toxin-antitoxin module
MSKVTSKLQVTLPKALADQYGIIPGNEIVWVAAGEVIKVLPPGIKTSKADQQTRLKLFDQSTQRQRRRQSGRASSRKLTNRGWTREDLYDGRGSH